MGQTIVLDESGQFDIELRWAPQLHVQLGIMTHDGKPLSELFSGGGEGEAGQLTAEVTSLWSTLGRSQINHLIRSLRSARDSAFGRDE